MAGLVLAYGSLSVYQIRNRGRINNIQAPPNFNWGTVYQIAPYGITRGTAVGQSVLYNGKETTCTLAFSGRTFDIFQEARIVTTEIP
jgi:hypothetical protein